MSRRSFRWLLVVYAALGLLSGFLDGYLVPSGTDFGTASAGLDALPGPALAGVICFAAAILIAYFAAWVGLYLFRPWAPRLAVAMTVLAMPLYLVPLGITPSSGSLALLDLSSVLWGVILAVALFSPLKSRFSGVAGSLASATGT